MLHTQALREEPYPNLSLPALRLQEPFLKDSAYSYIFEFLNSKVGANLVVMQLPELPIIALHNHPPPK